MKIYTIDLSFLDIQDAIAAFLIETSAGPVLIETGPHSTLDILLKGIEACGFQASDIRHVLLSHIHFDHAGAAWYFAQQGAQVFVHPFGYPHLNDPSRLLHSAKRIYQDDMDRLWGQIEPIAEEQLQAVDDQVVLQIGEASFKAWYTPGHASHHIAWQLGDQLFTGDVAGVSIGGGLVVPPCPPPDINLEDWKASIQLIRDMKPACLHLTHFGKIEAVDSHLNTLEVILDDWANWMRPHYESGRKAEEIIPLFKAYVAGQLEKDGLDDAAIEQYEAANPSWMSVSGLLRYWRKKLTS